MMVDGLLLCVVGLGVLALLIAIAGFFTGRNLPEKQKKVHILKFCAIALAIVAFGLPNLRPYVVSVSSAKYLDELKAENLNTTEDLISFEKEQTRQIERLRQEVVDLRADLKAVHFYFSALTQFLSILIGSAAIGFAFRKRKNEDDNIDEIRTN